jgi:hypothetical protein
MKTLWILTAAFIGLLAFSTGRLSAQVPVVRPPGTLPPVYSPFLNLQRNNNPAYLNYYGLVRPEIQFGNSIYGLQQGVAANAAGISGLDAATGLPLTGHPTFFMNTSHYFLNQGGQGTPAAAGAAAPASAISRGGPPAARAPR